MKKEKETQKAILDYLRLRKIPAWKVTTAGIRKPDGGWIPNHSKGMSDIIGVLPFRVDHCAPGSFLAIEVKSEKGVLSALQKEFLDTVNNSGGLAFMAKSVDDVANNLISHI